MDRLPVWVQRESDYELVSSMSLELYAHAVIFKCEAPPDFTKFGEQIGRDLKVVKQWLSADQSMTLLLTIDQNPPAWATSDVLVNIRHDAFLLIHRPQSQLCFIGSTRRTKKIYIGLIEAACGPAYSFLSYEQTSRARAGLTNLKFFAVGLRNSTLNSRSESYRVLTGPQAERRLSAGDSRGFTQGHFFGSGESEGQRETIGASGSSRIWSNQQFTVREYIDWIETLDRRLTGGQQVAATHLDLIRSATTLRRMPEKVIAGIFPKNAFRTNPKIRFSHGAGQPYKYGSLADIEFSDFACDQLRGELAFSARYEDFSVDLKFVTTGGRMVTSGVGRDVADVADGIDEWTPLDVWLSAFPPVFFGADMSSFEGVNYFEPPLLRAQAIRDEDAQALSWTGCRIDVEFLPNDVEPRTVAKRAELAGQRTVQEWLEEYLARQDGTLALYYDHRSGEAADFIAVRTSEGGFIDITLYHCKGAGGNPSGGRVGDVYELAGQLVKSIYYCDVTTLLEHMFDRMHIRHTSPSRFIVGDLNAVTDALAAADPTRIRFFVVAVQPGISKAAVEAHLADLMTFCIDYARDGGATGAYWLVSP